MAYFPLEKGYVLLTHIIGELFAETGCGCNLSISCTVILYSDLHAPKFVKKRLNVYSGRCAKIQPASMPLKLKGRKISNKHSRLKNPNWQEADQLAIYG